MRFLLRLSANGIIIVQHLGKPKEHVWTIAVLPFPCIQEKSIVSCNGVKVSDPCNQDAIVTKMTSGPLIVTSIYGVLTSNPYK